MEEDIAITKELCLRKLEWIGILHVATVDADNHPPPPGALCQCDTL